MKRIIAAILIGVVVPATVSAQDAMPTAGEAMGGSDDAGVVYKKETSYDFEADDVEGNLVKPDELGITADQHGKTSSLIKIRADFVPEMLKSVEDI